MQIDLGTSDKLMDFHQKYFNKDISKKALTPQVNEFVTKAFDSLTLVFGDLLKSCVLANPCIEQQGCVAECANDNISDFNLKLIQNKDSPYDFDVVIARNQDMFEIKCSPPNKDPYPYVFSYTSNHPGKSSDVKVGLYKNKPVAWSSSHSASSNGGDSSTFERQTATCTKAANLKCQTDLLDGFKSSLEDFKKDSETKEATDGVSLGAALLAGVGIAGVGLGLYAKRRSRQREMQKTNDLKTLDSMSKRDPKKAS